CVARQHINERDFEPARRALENALQLRPLDPDAHELLAELRRIEHRYIRNEQEKKHLCGSAKKFWEQGEVTAALKQLEKALNVGDEYSNTTEHDVEYKALYQRVLSEHNAIRDSFEQAQGLLAEHKLSAALAVCEASLSKYPSHSLFQ